MITNKVFGNTKYYEKAPMKIGAFLFAPHPLITNKRVEKNGKISQSLILKLAQFDDANFL